MKDEDIEKLLHELPRQEASPDFTPRLMSVLGRSTESSTGSSPTWLGRRILLAGATTLVLLGVVAFGLSHWSAVRERSEAAQRVETLRDEYNALERELEDLRSLAAASQPVVDIGGTDDVDILLDLRAIRAGTEQDQQVSHQPVEYRR